MKAETNKAEMKAIFPHFGEEGDITGGELKNQFRQRAGFLDPSQGRAPAARAMRNTRRAWSSIGGPFKKLSPAMEMWGRLLKCTGNQHGSPAVPVQGT